jgi:hypothetical protein
MLRAGLLVEVERGIDAGEVKSYFQHDNHDMCDRFPWGTRRHCFRGILMNRCATSVSSVLEVPGKQHAAQQLCLYLYNIVSGRLETGKPTHSSFMGLPTLD